MANLTSQIDYYSEAWGQADMRIQEVDRQLSSLVATCLLVRKDRHDGVNSDVEGGVRRSVVGMDQIRKQLVSMEDLLSSVKSSQPDRDVLLGLEKKVYTDLNPLAYA